MRALFDFKNSEAVRRWLGMDEGRQFTADLIEWRNQKNSSLKNSSELLQIGRAQGALEVLDRLIQMKEELSDGMVQQGRSTSGNQRINA